jgi:hypothetical protein
MSDFGDWMQNNWYQLGSFFTQLAFLCAAIWFARRILRTLRASQEQVGALLKRSVSGAATDRHAEAVPDPVSEASPYWLAPTPSQPATPFVTSQDAPIHLVSHPGFIDWLKTPMSITTGTSSLHRVLRWLQSPAST